MDYNCMTERFPSPAIPLSYKNYSHHPCPNSYTSISLTLSLSILTATSSFLQAGCPSCHPTNSVKALKGIYITFHGLAYPSQKKIH